MHNRKRTHALLAGSGLAAILAATLFLSGCSSPQEPSVAPSADISAFGHIHELQPEGGALLVASHEGLYRLAIRPNGDAIATGPLGGLDFDPMGFAIADGVAYASGHPGPTTPNGFGTPNLGLISSTDLGENWTNVSLTGLTDFHALTVSAQGVSAPRIFGIDTSNPRLQRSMDGGLTWSDGAPLAARDILAIGDVLYATTADGLAVSSDNGMSFIIDTTAPGLYVLASDSAGTLAGVDTAGNIWSRQPGATWTMHGTVTEQVQAFAVEGTRLYVADGRGITLSDDLGETWVALTVSR